MIPVNVAVEDALSEALLLTLLGRYGGPWAVRTIYNRGGYGYIKKQIKGFNQAAKGIPFLVLADTDAAPCAPAVLSDWLPYGIEAYMLLRFAIRESEAWVLADAVALANAFGIAATLIPLAVEEIPDPKLSLVNLARKSKRKDVVSDLVPPPGATALVGRSYNPWLAAHVQARWDPERARARAQSLDRAIRALEKFKYPS